jgi:hypothetical protein
MWGEMVDARVLERFFKGDEEGRDCALTGDWSMDSLPTHPLNPASRKVFARTRLRCQPNGKRSSAVDHWEWSMRMSRRCPEDACPACHRGRKIRVEKLRTPCFASPTSLHNDDLERSPRKLLGQATRSVTSPQPLSLPLRLPNQLQTVSVPRPALRRPPSPLRQVRSESKSPQSPLTSPPLRSSQTAPLPPSRS